MKPDPIILCRYLDQRDAKHDLIWLKWSYERTDLVDVYRPVIARVAGERLADLRRIEIREQSQ